MLNINIKFFFFINILTIYIDFKLISVILSDGM